MWGQKGAPVYIQQLLTSWLALKDYRLLFSRNIVWLGLILNLNISISLLLQIDGKFLLNSPLEPVIAALQETNTVTIVVARAQAPDTKSEVCFQLCCLIGVWYQRLQTNTKAPLHRPQSPRVPARCNTVQTKAKQRNLWTQTLILRQKVLHKNEKNRNARLCFILGWLRAWNPINVLSVGC